MWDDEIDPVLFNQLTLAYIRRQEFEARIIVNQIGRMFGGGDVGKIEKSPIENKASEQVDPDTMMNLIGVDMSAFQD